MIAASLSLPARAGAQPTTDHERALRHFEAGRAHVKAGRCDLAIEELKSSIDFEPTSVGARLNLGDCLVTLGRLPDAFRIYKEAEAAAAQTRDPRVDDARQSAASVAAKLVRVVLREPDPPAFGAVLAIDGGPPLARPWWVAVTPDEPHVLDVTTPDGRRWRGNVRAAAGDVVRVAIVLEAPASEAPPPSAQAQAQAQGSTHPLRTAGVIVGAAGTTMLVAGGVFAVLASTWRGQLADAVARDPRCTGGYPDGSCDPSARSTLAPIEDRAFLASTLADVGLVAGGALLAGGIVLWLVAPSNDVRASTKLRLGTGAFLEGAF